MGSIDTVVETFKIETSPFNTAILFQCFLKVPSWLWHLSGGTDAVLTWFSSLYGRIFPHLNVSGVLSFQFSVVFLPEFLFILFSSVFDSEQN